MVTRQVAINASAEKVLSTLLNFEKYPVWSGFKSVSVISTDENRLNSQVRFELETQGFSDWITLNISRLEENVISWSLVQSTQLSKLIGNFKVISVSENSCNVVYNLEIKFKNAILNLMKSTVEDQMVQKIMTRLANSVSNL